jgi:tRNA pseudouridine55 synthase
VPPRGSTPVGIVLVDKPAGPSSFALVSELRRRTGAKTGHTGTLDPLATGLLLLLSGMATKLAPCFSGLDKRYVTDVDLTSTTSTGDTEGDILERHPAPGKAELEERLERLRGEIELPIPAASAVKIGGERAYRLARRGIETEMPLRRSQVWALDVISHTGDHVTIGLHVSSGTYVRSIATALGGHCATLRRTAVGSFRVDEADPARLMPVSEALARLTEEARERVPYGLRAQVLAFEAEAEAVSRAGTAPPTLPGAAGGLDQAQVARLGGSHPAGTQPGGTQLGTGQPGTEQPSTGKPPTDQVGRTGSDAAPRAGRQGDTDAGS